MATADPNNLRMMAEAWGEEFFPTPPEDARPKDAAAAYVLRRGAVPHLLACADEIDRLRALVRVHAEKRIEDVECSHHEHAAAGHPEDWTPRSPHFADYELWEGAGVDWKGIRDSTPDVLAADLGHPHT